MVIPQARELTGAERKQGFTKIVFVTPGKRSKRGIPRDFRIISSETGRETGSISRIEFERLQRGQRKFRGELFIEVPPPPDLAAQLRAREERLETKALAQKEAEFEAKRIAEGKIKAKDVVLTQPGSKVILTRLLQEQARKELRERLKAPTTSEEFQRELQRKQRILATLTKQAEVAAEVARPKQPLELFSEKAIEQLGLGETAQGLLTITEGERKKVVERGKVLADIPVSAEFDKDFLSKIGTGFKEEELVGLKTPGGVLTFKTIAEIAKEKIEKAEEKVRPISQELLEFTPFDIQKALARIELEELEGKKGVAAATRRAILKSKIVSLTVPERIFQQFREQPVESSIFFGAGFGLNIGLAGFGLEKAPFVIKSAKALETLFFTGVAVETGIQVGKGDFEEAVGITTERITEAGLFVGGGLAASTLIQTVRPSRVKVIKAKELKAKFAETLETEGTSAKNLQRLGLKTETKIRLTRFQRGPQTRIIKTPKDSIKLAKLLDDPNVRFEFRIIDGVAKQVLVRTIPSTVVRPKIKPEPFEIQIKEGKIGIRVKTKFGEVTRIKDIKDVKLDLKRVIDPKAFERITGKDGLTILQKDIRFDIDRLGFDFRAELFGRARITGKVRPVREVADVFGIDLFPPQEITGFRPVTTRLGFRPILAVSPIFEPSPTILFPTSLFDLDLFGRRRVREPVLDILPGFDVTTDLARVSGLKSISESISKQDVTTDIFQIAEQARKGRRIQEPIIDIGFEDIQLPIVDVDVTQKKRQEVAVDLRVDLITEQVTEQKLKTQPPIIAVLEEKRRKKKKKEKAIGFNVFVKSKGRFVKTNKKILNKPSALSQGARLTDQSSSARFKVVKVKLKARKVKGKKSKRKKRVFDTGDRYFQRNKFKFRKFSRPLSRKKLQRRALPKDEFIEKRTFRIDTPGEKAGITLKGLIALRERRAARKLERRRSRTQQPQQSFDLDLFPTRRKKGRRGFTFF